MKLTSHIANSERRRGSTFLPPIALVSVFCAALGLLFAAGCSEDSVSPDACDAGFAPPDTLAFTPPATFPFFFDPPDNRLTVQGVALGRRLFYDPILSGDQSQSCASCHNQAFGFTDNGEATSDGIDGIRGTRNAPPIINVAWARSLFWDGRAGSIEDQAREPVPNAIEMHLPWNEAVARLQEHDEYPELFGAAFGSCEITEDRVVKAIAQFERTLVSADSKFDRFNRGEVELTAAEERGFRLFFNERGDCFHCHGTTLTTNGLFHDIGLDEVPPDSGLAVVTGNPNDYGKFKTPTLRNISYTAPYMHDGRFETLEEVVRHYEEGAKRSPNVDPLILVRIDRGPLLSDQEIDDIVAFLRTFDDPNFINNPDFSDPNR